MRASPIVIWLIGVSFVLFQLFLQLSSGVIIGILMSDMHLSGFIAGILSSALYVVYTGLQIPVGSLFDRKNTRQLMTVNVLLCSLGCLLFAVSQHLTGLFLGRILIGGGSAFAFVGLAHLLRQYFPLKRFAFMIGLSETMGFCISVLGMISMGHFIGSWGWRNFMVLTGIIGLILSVFCWLFIPNHAHHAASFHSHKQQIILILKNKTAWFNGLFVGLCFAIVTVFGALWSVPFLEVKLQCSLEQANYITAIFFLGTGLSCPVFGILSAKLARRKPLMMISAIATTFWLILVIYLPLSQSMMMGGMFLLGLSCGAYMLAYSIANELAPAGALSTCAGFTNTLALITTPLLQPTVGFILDLISQTKLYTVQDYQVALTILPLCTLVASFLVGFLPEKPHAAI